MIQFEKDPMTRAECNVLACLLQDADQMHYVAHWLRPAHFAHDLHGQVYRHMLALHVCHEPITVERVYERITQHGRIYRGIMPYLVSLQALRVPFPLVSFHALPMHERMKGEGNGAPTSGALQ